MYCKATYVCKGSMKGTVYVCIHLCIHWNSCSLQPSRNNLSFRDIQGICAAYNAGCQRVTFSSYHIQSPPHFGTWGFWHAIFIQPYCQRRGNTTYQTQITKSGNNPITTPLFRCFEPIAQLKSGKSCSNGKKQSVSLKKTDALSLPRLQKSGVRRLA